MIEIDADIVGERHCKDYEGGHFSSVTTTYRWEGGRIARIDSRSYLAAEQAGELIRKGDVILMGGLKLRIVADSDFLTPGYLVIRDSRWAWWYRLVYKMRMALSEFKGRLIWTAHIWGLAQIDLGCRAKWTDIHIIKWLSTLFKGGSNETK